MLKETLVKLLEKTFFLALFHSKPAWSNSKKTFRKVRFSSA